MSLSPTLSNTIPDGPLCFPDKNIRFQFGRCPVRALFKPALEILTQHAELFKSFIQHTVSIEEAPKYYDLFDKRKVRKTVFKFD